MKTMVVEMDRVFLWRLKRQKKMVNSRSRGDEQEWNQRKGFQGARVQPSIGWHLVDSTEVGR